LEVCSWKLAVNWRLGFGVWNFVLGGWNFVLGFC
jgi:hypothetical protein